MKNGRENFTVNLYIQLIVHYYYYNYYLFCLIFISHQSKNRQRQRQNEFEIINGTSSSSGDEQQFEVIPAARVRSFETEALKVCDDYYNIADDDSDIEVIPKESVLYSSALQKSKTSVNSIVDEINDAVGTCGADDMSHCNTDFGTEEEIEDPEDVLAMELDMICLLYTSPSPRDATLSRMPSSA